MKTFLLTYKLKIKFSSQMREQQLAAREKGNEYETRVIDV